MFARVQKWYWFLGRRYWFLKKSASPQNFSASYFSLDALFWSRSVSYFAATDRLPHTLPHSFSYDSSSFLEKVICLVTFSRTYLYIGWNRSKSLPFFWRKRHHFWTGVDTYPDFPYFPQISPILVILGFYVSYLSHVSTASGHMGQVGHIFSG